MSSDQAHVEISWHVEETGTGRRCCCRCSPDSIAGVTHRHNRQTIEFYSDGVSNGQPHKTGLEGIKCGQKRRDRYTFRQTVRAPSSLFCPRFARQFLRSLSPTIPDHTSCRISS